MPLFCSICNNLLSTITTADSFNFKCLNCHEIYKPTDEDTMIYEDTKGTDLVIYKTILQTAGRDPVNPKVYKDCEKCKKNIVRQVRLGENMRLINTCVNCEYQWVEGMTLE